MTDSDGSPVAEDGEYNSIMVSCASDMTRLIIAGIKITVSYSKEKNTSL